MSKRPVKRKNEEENDQQENRRRGRLPAKKRARSTKSSKGEEAYQQDNTKSSKEDEDDQQTNTSTEIVAQLATLKQEVTSLSHRLTNIENDVNILHSKHSDSKGTELQKDVAELRCIIKDHSQAIIQDVAELRRIIGDHSRAIIVLQDTALDLNTTLYNTFWLMIKFIVLKTVPLWFCMPSLPPYVLFPAFVCLDL
jgi:archaellum component FlaC